MNALDARTTSIELAKGNPADILQTVAWQRRLFQSLPLGRSACAARIVTASAEFDDAIASRKEKANRIYPRLLESVSGCLAEAGKQFGVDLAPDLSQISRVQSDLAALQKAHRDMLLRLSAVRPSPDAISNVGSR